MNEIFNQMMALHKRKGDEGEKNALYEVMQQIVLSGLHRGGFFNEAAFYGGTCLRIFYGVAPANGIVKLVGTASTNPAFTGGMTADALKALAAGSMTAEILGKDQSGNSRTGPAAGAYVGSAAQQ